MKDLKFQTYYDCVMLLIGQPKIDLEDKIKNLYEQGYSIERAADNICQTLKMR